jgi:hypothetical protein
MKATLYIAALPLLALGAFAQDPASQPTTPAKQDPAKTAAPAQDTQKDSGRPAEMKTQSFSGTLMDASCAGSGAASTASTPPSDSTASSDKSKATGDANRAAPDPGQSCSVSSSTAQFALKLKDGRAVKLDDVGNQRAQEAFKNKKKWSQDATANKPIHASVSGVLTDDKLLVMSIK